MVETFIWYQFQDKQNITIFTSVNTKLGGGNGFRFMKSGSEWKIDLSKNYAYNIDELDCLYHKIDIKDFDIPKNLFRMVFPVVFKSSGGF